jgi:hypothetical protein
MGQDGSGRVRMGQDGSERVRRGCVGLCWACWVCVGCVGVLGTPVSIIAIWIIFFLVPPWVIANIFYNWCKKNLKKNNSKMTFGFFRRPRENDVWHENYKWRHLAPDFSTDLVKLGPKLT